MPERRLDHGARNLLLHIALAFVAGPDLLRDGAGVDADPYRNPALLRGRGHGLDLLRPREVPRIDSELIDPLLDRRQREAVVEVDIGHQRDMYLPLDLPKRGRGLHVRHRHPHQIGPGLLDLAYLADRRADIAGVRRGHRLNADRRPPADQHPADVDFARCSRHRT